MICDIWYSYDMVPYVQPNDPPVWHHDIDDIDMYANQNHNIILGPTPGCKTRSVRNLFDGAGHEMHCDHLTYCSCKLLTLTAYLFCTLQVTFIITIRVVILSTRTVCNTETMSYGYIQ